MRESKRPWLGIAALASAVAVIGSIGGASHPGIPVAIGIFLMGGVVFVIALRSL